MRKTATDSLGPGTDRGNRDKQTLVLFLLGCGFVALPLLYQPGPPLEQRYTWVQQSGNGAWQVISTMHRQNVPESGPDSTAARWQHTPTQEKTPPALALFFNQPLPLNGCQEHDLEMLPGVGPRLASAIVATRLQKGRLAGPDDLLDVPGIGPATLQRLLPLISFE